MPERIITVKDKNGKKIAVFSNNTSIQTEAAKRNVMVSPTIDIVSNGESTLSFQMLVASEKWQSIKNPENLYYCNNRVYTALNEQSIVYNGPVVNVTLVELWYLLAYKYVQAHNVDTRIEAIDDHTVKILPKTDKKFKLTVNGVQYDDSEVVDSRGVLMPRGSAGYALWALLKGTDWTLGVCDVLPDGFDAANDYGTFNVETDMKDVLQNIQFVQQQYGGILDWDSEHKVLSLRDEKKDSDFNTWKGFAIRKGKNLSDYPVITWDNNIITRLYPLGNGNLNIKKVNGNKGYVENFSYTSEIYESYMQNPSIYDTNDEGGQKTLKYWGEQQVEKYCKPRKSISYSVVDFRGTEKQGHENFDVNDIAKCYYQDTETGQEVFEYLRIQHLNYNYFFPGSESTVEVGDKIANETELFYQLYKSDSDSAKTDQNGNISGEDIYLMIPEEYWEQFGGFGYASLQLITNLHAEHETENTQAIADLRVYADDTFATITSFTEFKEWTEEGFKESSTRIDQVSTALYAQIELEARHHEESLKYTQESVASLRLYVDGDFAQAQLKAAYAYSDKKTKEVSNSLAQFEAYADREYAKASMLASYATKNELNNSISQSTSSIQAWANARFAGIDLESRVSGIDTQSSSYISINPQAVLLSVRDGGSVSIQSGVTIRGGTTTISSGYLYVTAAADFVGSRVNLNGDSVRILGKSVYWSNGYLRG